MLVRENDCIGEDRGDLPHYQAHDIRRDDIAEGGKTLSDTPTKDGKLALQSAKYRGEEADNAGVQGYVNGWHKGSDDGETVDNSLALSAFLF